MEKVIRKNNGQYDKGSHVAAILDIRCRNEFNRHYLYIRKTPKNLVALHRSVWEATTGDSIYTHQVLIFKDGNPANCKFNNLEMVTRKDLRRREIEHDETNLVPENINTLVEYHKEEIELVQKYFRQ